MMMILRAAAVFFLFTITVNTHAQQNKWLQGSWQGKAFFAGSDATQFFALTLRIFTVKDRKFEGILITMEPSDTSIRYDCKISGTVYDKYLVIEHSKVFYVKDSKGSRWQLSCINCRPSHLIFAINENTFSFKGEVTDCYKECNGTSEFTKVLKNFNADDKAALYAMLHLQNPDSTTIAVVPNVIAPTQDTTITKTADDNEAIMQRTPLLPASNIISTKKQIAVAPPPHVPSTINKSTSFSIIENVSKSKQIAKTIDTISKSVINNNVKTAVIIKPVPAGKNPLLPEGFAERKVSLIRTLPIDTDSVTLRLYDNGVVDGDIVSVIYNDVVVVDKLSLTSRAMVVKIAVSKLHPNMLVFHAHNLGEFPPNTARLEIIYGNKTEALTVSSDLTVSSAINLVYAQ